VKAAKSSPRPRKAAAGIGGSRPQDKPLSITPPYFTSAAATVTGCDAGSPDAVVIGAAGFGPTVTTNEVCVEPEVAATGATLIMKPGSVFCVAEASAGCVPVTSAVLAFAPCQYVLIQVVCDITDA
jgi:hypothetical protein